MKVGGLAGVLVLLAGVRAGATVYAPAEWSELVVAARAIAHGRIIDVRAQAAADRRRVETLVTLQVATYLKGHWGPTVTFRVPGGQIGRYRTVVPGAPRFAPGEEVVLLLGAQGPSIPHVLGLSQGVFRVYRDTQSGERRVTPVPVEGAGEEWTSVVRGDPSRGPLALTDFARGIQRILGASR
jgi:hypothetical protein